MGTGLENIPHATGWETGAVVRRGSKAELADMENIQEATWKSLGGTPHSSGKAN